MRKISIVASVLLAGAARAATGGADGNAQVPTGAAPAWVHPVAMPAADPAAAGTAVQVLLQDEQIDLKPGAQARYFESAYKLQTAQGLMAGRVGLSWNPDTQSVMIHKLHILRGDAVIDVLAAGQSFTVVRREQNLENAALDGVLTATLQPEGLQVGDIVDLAATVTNHDPALGRHVEIVGAAWNALPIGRAHFRAQWPAAVAVQVKADGDLGALASHRQGELAVLELARERVKPTVAPAGAPPRFGIGRLLEISDQAGWSGIAALMAPLYAKAAVIAPGSALAGEVARIKAAEPDPIARAEAALVLVQDRVRYVYSGVNDGGLLPADAETTWSRRFGDCKGKTVLLLAMLHALGIEAQPVLVSTTLGDGLGERLPMVGLFDHVLVRSSVGGKDYWLDGTRLGDRHLAGLAVPAFHWGLPLASGSRALVPIMPAPLDRPSVDITLRIDARGGVRAPASAHAERLIRGDDAVATNLQIGNLSPEAREQGLREFWKAKYDFITPTKVTATFDAERRELRLAMDGSAKMEWTNGWYEADGVWVGYKADFVRDPAADQHAPYAVPFPSYSHTVETILLPPGQTFTTEAAVADVDQTVAGISYRRHAAVTGDTFIVEESDRAVAPEFPAADAPAAQDALRALAKRTVYLRMPDRYAHTKADGDAIIAGPVPTDAAGLITRGNLLMDRHELDKAIADFDRALTMEPRNARGLGDRGIANVYKGDLVAAARDLDAASAIDPHDTVPLHGRAMLALAHDNPQSALVPLTQAITVDSADSYALGTRAEVNHRLRNEDAAMADAAALLKLNPQATDMSLMRANILRNRGDKSGAIAELTAAVKASPTSDYARVAAANMMVALGERTQGMAAFAEAIRLTPTGLVYYNRAVARDPADVAGREADYDQASKLEPTWTSPLTGKAKVRGEQRDWPGAIALLTRAHAIDAKDPIVLLQRADAYGHIGQPALATADLAAIAPLTTTPVMRNNVCWYKGTHRLALDTALADCDAAVAGSPQTASFLDSRGLVLLQLGRNAEAVASYDRALAHYPIPGSLFGRAVAEAKLGRNTDASRDLAAAVKADPDIRHEFAAYGVTYSGN